MATRGLARRFHYLARRNAAITALGGPTCKHCGTGEKPTRDGRAYLQIDHIDGGEHHKRTSRVTVLRYVLAHPNEFQVLCPPCHKTKDKKKK
jgi:hypothetical protein